MEVGGKQNPFSKDFVGGQNLISFHLLSDDNCSKPYSRGGGVSALRGHLTTFESARGGQGATKDYFCNLSRLLDSNSVYSAPHQCLPLLLLYRRLTTDSNEA